MYCECGCGQITPLARQTDSKRGWIVGQHIKCIRGHKPYISLADRFWKHVIPLSDDECWLWQGATFVNKRYGHISVHGTGQVTEYAHRISWILHYGDIPEDLVVCHKCDNPPCCNPPSFISRYTN